jgi:hypothetical protein
VPVAAKLSKAFYDRFGEEIANELVELFNVIDAAHRSDLREVNELNFVRFDARLEQRLAQSDAKWEQRMAQLDTKWEQRIAQLDVKWEQRMGQVELRIAQLEAGIERRLADQGRWLILMWGTIMAAMVGLWTR